MTYIFLPKSGKFFHLILFISLFSSFHSLAQWTKTGGPPGINVNVFYEKGNILYCGTSSKGVFKSTDHGVTWSAANTGIENNDVFSLVATSSFLFAGTNDGVFRSSDDGSTWTSASSGIEGKFVYSFQVANGFIFAGTISFGLFKSNDQGLTWTDANGGALGSSSIYALAFSPPNLIAMADNLIFYSKDNGTSWFIPNNSPFLFSSAVNFVVSHDSVMINTLTGVFQSFNAGKSWDPVIIIDDNASFCGLVRSGKRIYIASASKIYFSTNFGSAWTQVNAQGLRIGTRFIHHFYKSGSNLLIGFDELGVAYSSDKAKHWNYTLSGFPSAATIDNALVAAGKIILSGTHSDGVYKSTDNGATWSKIGTTNNSDSLSNGIVFSLLKTNSVILAGTCGFGLYRSADNGATWTHILNGLPSQSPYFLCVFSLAKASSNIIAATDLGIYYSTDNGLTWHASNITGSDAVAVGVAANDSVACATVEATTGSNNIYRSTNKGQTWNTVFSTFVDDFTCIASNGTDHFYAGSFSNNYVSSNNGLTWSNFGSGIPSGTGAFAIAAVNNDVFVGNGEGLFFSNDNASTFTDESAGLDPAPNNAVQGLAISSANVYAGLFNNAVWKRPLSDFNLSPRAGSPAQEIEILAKIVPNPVSEQSVLGYEVKEASRVQIILYDLSGNTIEELFDASQPQGIYQLPIDKNNLVAGDYLMMISIGEKRSSIKFTVAE